MSSWSAIREKFSASRAGNAAIEFALVGPAFILMLCGILAWGGYFWTAHAVQQVANDAARAAVGGLSQAERETLVRATVAAEIDDYAYLDAADAGSTVTNHPDRTAVAVSYDASQTVFFALRHIVPMPSPVIVRQASVRHGGY